MNIFLTRALTVGNFVSQLLLFLSGKWLGNFFRSDMIQPTLKTDLFWDTESLCLRRR